MSSRLQGVQPSASPAFVSADACEGCTPEVTQGGPERCRAGALSQEERGAWLARVSRSLATQRDEEGLFQCVQQLALPLLGDWGGVELLQEQGLGQAALFSRAPGEAHASWARSFSFNARVLHMGRAQLLSGPLELILPQLAQDEEHLRMLQEVGLQDFLAIPLLRGGEAAGCLWFVSTEPSARLGPAELALAEQLALLLAPMLEATRLRRLERQLREREAWRARKIEHLRRVVTALGEARLPEQVADVVMTEVREAVRVRAATVYRLEASGGAVERLHASGPEPEVVQREERISLARPGPIPRAVGQRESIWVESGEELRRDYPALAARAPELEGALGAIPLLLEGRVLGVLALSFEGSRRFSEEERAFAFVLAQLCAQALERVRLHHQLQGQVEEFRTLLEVIPVGIGIARDPDCRHVEQNPAFARMLGVDLGRDVSASAPEAERVEGLRFFHKGRRMEPEEMPLNRAARTGKPVLDLEFDILVKGRPPRTLLAFIAPLFDKQLRPRGAIGAYLDITERKRAAEGQSLLAESSAILAASLEPERTFQTLTRLCVPTLASMALLCERSADGRLGLVACAHEETALEARLVALSQEGCLLGESLSRRVLESGQPLLLAEAAGALGELGGGEEARELLRRLALRSLMVIPLMARGRTLGVLTCGSRYQAYGEADFTLTKEFADRAALAVDNARLYREARQAIALRDEFLGVAGHELRTPLTALQLGLHNLSRQRAEAEPEKLARWIAHCQHQGVRLGRLVNDLLDVGRIVGGRLTLGREAVDLSALLQEVLAQMAPAFEKAECAVSLATPGPVVGRWDRLRLEQVLTNLLGNAVKYGPGHPIELSVSATSEQVVLRVRDHGIGIAPGDQARIFQRFERAVPDRHYGGLGLGLWISQQIVALHGGHIDVQSAPGQGATFTVRLPREAR